MQDFYEEYVSRKRAAEEAAERDLAWKRRPKTAEEALIPRWDLRECFADALAGITVRTDGGYEIRGPLCSEGLHLFVVRLAPYGVMAKKDRGNTAASTGFTLLAVMATCLPLVGWVLSIPFWLLGLLFGARSDRANRKHLAPESHLREAEEAAERPWRWWLAREGTEPWPAVVTDDYQRALALGIHHPARDASGGWLVAQVEKSLVDVVAMSKRILDTFTY